MEVTKLVVNSVEITLYNQPIGLEDIKVSLSRDMVYSCIDTTMDVDLKFYCGSGKEQIDIEFEAKGVEGTGYLEITDNCGTDAIVLQFNLDFKTYSKKGEYTSIGLIDVNTSWKDELNRPVNMGSPVDFYVRNLALEYGYHSDKFSSQEKTIDSSTNNTDFLYDVNLPLSGNDSHLSLYPRTYTTLNELESGAELTAETMYFELHANNTYIELPNTMEYIDFGGTVVAGPASNYFISDIDITPIFENEVEDGEITITTTGDSGVLMTFYDFFDFYFEVLYMTEIVIVARDWGKWNEQDIKGYIREINSANFIESGSNPGPGSPSSGYQVNYINALFPTVTQTKTIQVKKGEKVWIFYTIRTDDDGGLTKFKTNNYQYDLNRTVDIDFKITKNVTTGTPSVDDIPLYHTKSKAFYSESVLNTIFGTTENIGGTPCFEDLWFSRGDLLRGKINYPDTIVKPADFFRELEKVVCCGIGYFYDNLGNSARKLLSVYDFYTDNLVPSQYQFGSSDLIDSAIDLQPYSQIYYNEINVGYSVFKDIPKDINKENKYTVDSLAKNTYSKVSEFVASQWVITKAMKLGSEDKKLEYDDNIFIFSGVSGLSGIVSGVPTNFNVTLSESSGIYADNTFQYPTNYKGINRRYATIFNLFRHLYKWGFSMFNYSELEANKYKGIDPTINEGKIRDTTGANASANYFGLSGCMLPYDSPTIADGQNTNLDVSDLYEWILSDMYIPTTITFKTAKLSSLDLMRMREFQYDLFTVTDGTNTYYGNLISANLSNDVTEIKLLRRFKNGLIP